MSYGETENTREQLKHYFGNEISILRVAAQRGRYKEGVGLDSQRNFVEGVKETIRLLRDGGIEETPGIGEPELQRMLDAAREYDWKDQQTVRRLYELYGEITGKEFDESLFRGL